MVVSLIGTPLELLWQALCNKLETMQACVIWGSTAAKYWHGSEPSLVTGYLQYKSDLCESHGLYLFGTLPAANNHQALADLLDRKQKNSMKVFEPMQASHQQEEHCHVQPTQLAVSCILRQGKYDHNTKA